VRTRNSAAGRDLPGQEKRTPHGFLQTRDNEYASTLEGTPASRRIPGVRFGWWGPAELTHVFLASMHARRGKPRSSFITNDRTTWQTYKGSGETTMNKRLVFSKTGGSGLRRVTRRLGRRRKSTTNHTRNDPATIRRRKHGDSTRRPVNANPNTNATRESPNQLQNDRDVNFPASGHGRADQRQNRRHPRQGQRFTRRSRRGGGIRDEFR